MKFKIFLVSILSMFCVFFLTVYFVNSPNKTELQKLKENIEINNINVNARKESYILSEKLVKELNKDIINYFLSGDDGFLMSFSEKNISDINYFKYIMEVNSGEKAIDEVLKSKSFKNFQFFDKNTNSFVDYYYYKGVNFIPATLEITYSNGKIKDSKVY